MKLEIVGVLALCLILTNAASVDPFAQSTRALENYAESLAEKADQVSHDLEAKYDEIIVQPIQHVEASVAAIEERKEESEQCVDQQQDEIDSVVKSLESSLDSCTQTASTSSAGVAVEIVVLSVEVAYDTVNLVKSVQRCRQYKYSVLRKSCYATQLIKAERLIVKTKRAAENINKSVDETIPEILHEFEGCSAAAEESALAQLENINRNIDSCVAFL